MEFGSIIRRNPTMNIDRNYSYFLYEPKLKKRHQMAKPNDIMYRYFPNENDIIIKGESPKDNYRFIFMEWKKLHLNKKN